MFLDQCKVSRGLDDAKSVVSDHEAEMASINERLARVVESKDDALLLQSLLVKQSLPKPQKCAK